MAGLEEEPILLAKLEQMFGGREQVSAYQALKTNTERIDFVYHSSVVQELFKIQLQAMKKSHQELADEGNDSQAGNNLLLQSKKKAIGNSTLLIESNNISRL